MQNSKMTLRFPSPNGHTQYNPLPLSVSGTCEDVGSIPWLGYEQGDGVSFLWLFCHVRLSWWLERDSLPGCEDLSYQVVRASRYCEWLLLTASNKTRISVLQPEGTESHQQPCEPRRRPQAPDGTPLTPWFSPETLSREPGLALPRFLTYRDCEVINGCCFRPLSLW